MSEKLVNLSFNPLDNKHHEENWYIVVVAAVAIVVGMTFKICFSYNVLRLLPSFIIETVHR